MNSARVDESGGFRSRRAPPRVLAALIGTTAMLAACDNEGFSTLQVEEAAKEKARQELGLGPDATLVSQVFVGEPVDGEMTLCGTVSGKRADGTAVEPQRFIVSTEPWKWLLFENARKPPMPSQPRMFVEWHTTCLGEQEV